MKAMHKRLLVLLAAVLLVVSVMGVTAFAAQTEEADEPVCYEHGDVNGDGVVNRLDAVRLLFHTMFPNNSAYSVNQDCDFAGNGDEDRQDVIHLLFASLGVGNKQLKGTIHNYFDPIWTWDTTGDTPTAQVSLKCACGQPHAITEGITVTAGTVTEPTCVASGSREYTASVTYNGTVFENTYTLAVPATGDGHSFAAEPTCKEGVKCQNCDYVKPALDHSYVLLAEETVSGCKHTKRYQCSVCQETVDGTAEGDVYYTHSYTAAIETEATCSQVGKKVLTCACGDTQYEDIPKNDSHTWVEGATADGVTAYTCACGETKTVVAMTDSGVSADALKENEVKLDDAGTSVSLDEATAGQLDTTKTVVISVTEVDKDDITGADATEMEQAHIVYDFSMQYSDGTPITSFEGKVTVVLPYELQDGDDADSIDVWYIADDGTVECVKGVYANGCVTFQTDHFSYYTVTRLTPAQRCAVYGHINVTATKDATCSEDGYSKVYCQRCGHVDSEETKLMLGHDYQKDTDRSKDATCAAPGELVEICAHCKHERREDVKQLTHDWEKTGTVEASCTGKGHDKYTCKLCQGEKTDNEQEAKGHSWQVAENGWAWSEDYSKATVTLVCSHENTHTKELTAVITKNLEGSVCAGGEITYTATASYNNKVFTDSVTGTQTGVGHTPDSKWEASDTQHYHLCSVCGEKVGIADHDWVRTVNTAATCSKAGEATDKCSVCDKEREVILPATGEHSFVNGVCSACGYAEGSCTHKKLTKREIDLSEYGACEEGTVTVMSCDCGQVSEITNIILGCEELAKSEKYDEENNYSCNTYTCETCGLVVQIEQYLVIDRETCEGNWVQTCHITKGEETVLDIEDPYYTYSHPVIEEHDPVKLADYGLCGGTLESESCPCGARYYYYANLSCDIEWSENGVESDPCSVCGATLTVNYTESKTGCTYSFEETYTYKKDGAVLYSYTTRICYMEHSYKATSWELYGDSCEDGVYIESVCADCGDVDGYFYRYCNTCIEQERIDTTGAGFCSDAIVLRSCPCGAQVDHYLRYADGAQQNHSWEYHWDEELGEYQVCLNCGYQHTVETTYGEKDENCLVDVRKQHTYTDNKGHSFGFATYYRKLLHAYERSFVLKGDSCEDGVEITETCADCGYTYTCTTTGHYTYDKETLDLTEYGFCDQTVTLAGCPCGYRSYVSLGGCCDWEWIGGGLLEGGGQFHEEQCTVCGIIWRQESAPGETDDPCKLVYHYTHSFLKDGQTLGSIGYDREEENHRYVYDMKLNEGAVDCTGGYSYTATCLTCGDSYTSNDSGCVTRPVARETIQAEGTCGEFEKITYRCACGKKSSTEVISNCSYEHSWVESLQSWAYVCSACGSYYKQTYSYESVAGTTCQMRSLYTAVYYTADGEEIGTEERSWTWESHDWIYTYTLLGETCDDGWTYSLCCADCGETETYTEIQYGCDTNLVERTVVYENEAICGPVYVNRYACACGAEEEYNVVRSCRGSWSDGYFTCDTCGLKETNGYSYEHISGTCRETVVMKYTYLLNGETVATVEKTWEQADHIWVYSFQLNGDSCEDGYTINRKCAYCDYSESWGSSYGHETWRTAYYELPEGSCDGYVQVYACACGQTRRVEYTHENNFRGTSREETDENGIVHHYIDMACSECGMTMEQEWYDTAGADACHAVRTAHYTWKLGDWELSLSGRSTATNHTWKTVSLTPRGDDCEEDGVAVVDRCTVCSTENSYTAYSHRTMVAETVDLAQYGSKCGGTLELYKCPCGKYQYYEFSEDTQCDLDEKSTSDWIEGVLDDNYFTTHYWNSIWSDACIYTCAVTDPACGMKIRMARYWLNENCTAVQYETWQLGYDAETGECLKEITIPTGETRAYHPYEESYVNETVDGQSVSGYKYTCPDCGSYYTELSYYNDEGRQDRFVRSAVNTLDNGERQKLTEIWERVYFNDCQYTSLQRDEYVRADGSTYWYQYAYTYDFTDGCYRTEVYTNSSGDTSTYTEQFHNTSWSYEWIKEPTCTQFGKYVERYTCQMCGEVTSEYTYDAEPNAHYWCWDSDKQTYVCDYCDLESANGASGSIVMEDLTADYTDGNYVIGYWNRGEITFNPYVSLILYDAAEGEADELVLTGIDFTYLTVANDGICGLTFSQEAAANAAAAAIKEAGYTGTYAVRISFVPVGSTDTLDYAITFDTLTAE